MKTAWLYLRHRTDRRYEIFTAGLKRHGFKIKDDLPGSGFGPQDILISWNRLAAANNVASLFESRNQMVLIAENATWGNEFTGKRWFHIARNRHNTAGRFPRGNCDRWGSLGVELKPFRDFADYPEIVILPQRGIGSDPTRMPAAWPRKAVKKYGGRIRRHPGRFPENYPTLEDDLKKCGKVVTWGSGAAIKALMMGVPVISEMPNWIGSQDNTEADRLRMFRELAWTQWTHEEIESGFAFERLLVDL